MLVPSLPFRSRGVQIVSGKFGDNVAEGHYCPIIPSLPVLCRQSTPLCSAAVARVHWLSRVGPRSALADTRTALRESPEPAPCVLQGHETTSVPSPAVRGRVNPLPVAVRGGIDGRPVRGFPACRPLSTRVSTGFPRNRERARHKGKHAGDEGERPAAACGSRPPDARSRLAGGPCATATGCASTRRPAPTPIPPRAGGSMSRPGSTTPTSSPRKSGTSAFRAPFRSHPCPGRNCCTCAMRNTPGATAAESPSPSVRPARTGCGSSSPDSANSSTVSRDRTSSPACTGVRARSTYATARSPSGTASGRAAPSCPPSRTTRGGWFPTTGRRRSTFRRG
jgi:hypothetical protein